MRVRGTAGPVPTAGSVVPSDATGTTAVIAVSAGIGRTEDSVRAVTTVIVAGRTVTGAVVGAVTTAGTAVTTAGGKTVAETGTASGDGVTTGVDAATTATAAGMIVAMAVVMATATRTASAAAAGTTEAVSAEGAAIAEHPLST